MVSQRLSARVLTATPALHEIDGLQQSIVTTVLLPWQVADLLTGKDVDDCDINGVSWWWHSPEVGFVPEEGEWCCGDLVGSVFYKQADSPEWDDVDDCFVELWNFGFLYHYVSWGPILNGDGFTETTRAGSDGEAMRWAFAFCPGWWDVALRGLEDLADDVLATELGDPAHAGYAVARAGGRLLREHGGAWRVLPVREALPPSHLGVVETVTIRTFAHTDEPYETAQTWEAWTVLDGPTPVERCTADRWAVVLASGNPDIPALVDATFLLTPGRSDVVHAAVVETSGGSFLGVSVEERETALLLARHFGPAAVLGFSDGRVDHLDRRRTAGRRMSPGPHRARDRSAYTRSATSGRSTGEEG